MTMLFWMNAVGMMSVVDRIEEAWWKETTRIGQRSMHRPHSMHVVQVGQALQTFMFIFVLCGDDGRYRGHCTHHMCSLFRSYFL